MKVVKRKILAPLLLILALGCSGPSAETKRNDALASQQLAYAFLQEGRPARALQELAKAEALTPADPQIQNMMALAYWARKEYGLAEQRFRKATELKPEFSEAWNNLGALYIEQNRFSDAVTVLQRALSNVYYSAYETAMANLGWALYKLGRLPEARAKLEEASEVNPTHPMIRLNLGTVLFDLGENEESLRHVNEALRVNPDFAKAHLQKGMILSKAGDRQGAKESFAQAWKLAPGTEVGKTAKTYLDFLEK